MLTTERVALAAIAYYNGIKQDGNGRFRSWEHCYWNFICARGKTDADHDYLSLQLAFYLASWGMYRGSSFLLQKDYKVHVPVVGEILKPKYNPLAGIACSDYRDTHNQKLLEEIASFLKEYYDNIRKSLKDNEVKNEVSTTLITKILMGTLGCVPAYDRYFLAGIKANGVASGRFNIKSVREIAEFYEKNVMEFERIRSEMRAHDIPYPQMKIMDMGFWQIGFAKQ